MVRAITAPVNTTSIACHQSMGFTVLHPAPDSSTAEDDYVRFSRDLG